MAENLDEMKEAVMKLGPLSGTELLGAVAAICYLMASIDDEISKEETERILRTLRELSGSDTELESVQVSLVSMMRDVRGQGQERFVRGIAEKMTDPQQRRKALAYAAAVAFVDGRFDFEEEVLLGTLAEAFEIPKDEAEHLIDQVRGAAD